MIDLLIDTDIFSDVDDVGALALAHAFADEELVDIRAVVVNTESVFGTAMVRSINHFYGRSAIPVGARLPQSLETADHDFARQVSRRHPPPGVCAPSTSAHWVLRSSLAGLPDSSATIDSLGLLHNLSTLLRTGPDRCSPLGGRDLVRRKVARTVVMGGAFPDGTHEFNLSADLRSTRHVLEDWPRPIEFLGWEAGHDVITGSTFGVDAEGPVADAYRTYCGAGNGRPSWDLQTVSLAVLGTDGEYEVSGPGVLAVDPDGLLRWRVDEDGLHSYVRRIESPEVVASRLEVRLVREPAARRRRRRPLRLLDGPAASPRPDRAPGR